jgi:hypothetical protein
MGISALVRNRKVHHIEWRAAKARTRTTSTKFKSVQHYLFHINSYNAEDQRHNKALLDSKQYEGGFFRQRSDS